MKKADVERIKSETAIATDGTELERLDQLEAFLNQATEALAQIRESAQVMGDRLFRIDQAMRLRRIKVLHEATQEAADNKRRCSQHDRIDCGRCKDALSIAPPAPPPGDNER